MSEKLGESAGICGSAGIFAGAELRLTTLSKRFQNSAYVADLWAWNVRRGFWWVLCRCAAKAVGLSRCPFLLVVRVSERLLVKQSFSKLVARP